MKSSERGFLVIELVVVIGISAIIALGAGMTTVQLITSTQRNNDQLAAANHAQKAGDWISQDVMMSQNVTLGDDGGTADIEFASLVWKDWQTGDTHTIRYIWLDSSDSLQKLQRNYVTRDVDEVIIDNKTTLVADNIYSANLTQQGNLWQLAVQARSGQKSVSRQYQIAQRQNY